MSTALLAALLLVQTPAPGPLAEAEAFAREGALDRALAVLEAALAAAPRDAELERALARTFESLVDSGGSWLALSDARDAWDRALALEPDDLAARSGAIAVRLRLGEHEAARALAERALGSALLASGAASPELLELACRAHLASLPAPAGDPTLAAERSAALARAWSALGHARVLAPECGALAGLAGELLEAEGLPQRAAEELERALATRPDAVELHRALADLHLRAGVEERLAPLYERLGAGGARAVPSWFAGLAWRLAGDLAQRERRFRDALAAYSRAREWVGVAATLAPDFRATADAIRFQSEVSSAWCALDAGDLDGASARLLALLAGEPARRAEPDGLGRTLLDALAALGERRVERGEFARAVDEARAVVAALPDDGTWWNNLAFLLREHATQLAAGRAGADPDGHGEPGESERRAREVFRHSWKAYLRAAELLPEDARVQNDAAVVQVYHLRDDLAAAETLLERAVALAEARLAALGPASGDAARFPLAQALGDAWLNLGYLAYHVYRQPTRAREAFARSLASDSGERADVVAYLAHLDGAGPPVAEPDRGALVRAPATEPPERGVPAWEASLAEGRERARSEERALLVYHRGEALGLAVEELDELVRSPAFERRTRGVVLVLSDAERLTFVDRRHDGRRVPCPRFGGVTCGEHAAAYAEVRAWLAETLGTEPGESEEGLWLLAPGAEAPAHLGDLDELGSDSDAAPGGRGSGPFEAIEAGLGGEDGPSEARALVATRSLAARLAVERVLWDGFRSSPARDYLLAALAEDPSPGARELLAAAVRQSQDEELQRRALAVWPEGSDLEPVRHAWRWATAPEARAAAAAVLRRERPDDPLWSALAVLGAR